VILTAEEIRRGEAGVHAGRPNPGVAAGESRGLTWIPPGNTVYPADGEQPGAHPVGPRAEKRNK